MQYNDLMLAQWHRCLGNSDRLRIVHLLALKTLPVTAVQKVVSTSQVVVSKHLAYLYKRGIIDRNRVGNMVLYGVAKNQTPALALVINCLKECAAHVEVLQRDAAALQNVETALLQPRPKKQPPSRASKKTRPPVAAGQSDNWLFHGGDEYID